MCLFRKEFSGIKWNYVGLSSLPIPLQKTIMKQNIFSTVFNLPFLRNSHLKIKILQITYLITLSQEMLLVWDRELVQSGSMQFENWVHGNNFIGILFQLKIQLSRS